MPDADEDDALPENEPIDEDGTAVAVETVVPEDVTLDDAMRETEVQAKGDEFGDEIVSMQNEEVAGPDPDDGMRQTEVYAIDQLDVASEAAEGDVEEPDGDDDDDDKENRGDDANRPSPTDGAEDQHLEGQEWSGLCTRHGQQVTRRELFANVTEGQWGASDLFRLDGQSVSNEMLGNTMVHVKKLMTQAGVDW